VRSTKGLTRFPLPDCRSGRLVLRSLASLTGAGTDHLRVANFPLIPSARATGARLAAQQGAGQEMDLVGALDALGDVDSDEEVAAARSDDE
jgi:hypothetical protein